MVMASLAASAQTTNMGHHDMVHLTTNLPYDAALVPSRVMVSWFVSSL